MNPPASRVLILGFYDGATDGVVEFGPGSVYRFDWADDSPERCGDPERTFTFRPLPADALDRLTAVITPFHAPGWPVWLPDWSFPTAADRDAVTAAVDAILSEAGARAASVTTADTVGFQTYCWTPTP
ncbi:MAG: hypothetical protein U0804_19930 [Gemmataceae bacterium]